MQYSRGKPNVAHVRSSSNIALCLKTDADFVTFDLLTQTKWASRTHRGTFVIFGDPSCIVLRCRLEKQTNSNANPTHAIPVGVCNFVAAVADIKEKERKSIYIAPFIYYVYLKAQAWITQYYLQIHHACLSFVSIHQMAPPLTEVRDI